MFGKKKEEKNLAWYENELKKKTYEVKVIRDEYENRFAELHYPMFKEKLGKYFKAVSHRNGCSYNIYYVLLDVQPEDVYIGLNDEPLAYCRASSISRDADGDIKINLSGNNYVHSLGEEISEREYKEAVYGILLEATSLLPNWRMFE